MTNTVGRPHLVLERRGRQMRMANKVHNRADISPLPKTPKTA
eukprot:CAMPEP_0119554322 /NCGR_PEP_ID=MMETSP1352-20130426/6848_1 /TAXON_ID=265584 /ORGANISM="Stauroneis constricta, Strain CCMP1120" /LENGTH=41 /DNA_ID= /DNA_START= /DNA_END= /DNA_ORIENTATION=